MSIWLWIYLVGIIVAFSVSVCIFRDKDKRINFSNTFVALMISTLSWISVLALWVGLNIKNAVDKSEEQNPLDGYDGF